MFLGIMSEGKEMDNGKSVFVVMPVSKTDTCTEEKWTEIYENVFKPAIEDCGYVCERANMMAKQKWNI